MKVQPVKNYKTPSYPTREEYLSQKNNLSKNLPDRWLNNKVVAGALAFLFLGNNSDTNTASVKPNLNAIILDTEKSETLTIKKVKSDEKVPSIAPLFIHGGGRGSSGCVIINPPSFLTEEEARQIIETELKKEGIIFDQKNYRVDNAVFERRYTFQMDDYSTEDDIESYLPFRENDKDTVVLDAFSTKYNLGYEFVSVDDSHLFGSELDASSVQSYDLISASQRLREKMKESGKINTVIFYDPIEDNEEIQTKNKTLDELKRYTFDKKEDSDTEWQERRKIANEKSYELLKKQVADFIDWVKKEGLLKENK